MFRVLSFIVLIRVVAIATTILTLLSFGIVQHFFPQFLSPVALAPTVAFFLTLLLTSKWASRQIWKAARYFDPTLYPDLNGTWVGEIEFGEIPTKLQARAVIRQYLLSTEIDMHTETAKSSTLEATPVISSGQFKLYYTYNAKPKKAGYGAYTGSTIFDIRLVNDGKKDQFELSGYYYTDRATLGRTRLRQISSDTKTDVSFY